MVVTLGEGVGGRVVLGRGALTLGDGRLDGVGDGAPAAVEHAANSKQTAPADARDRANRDIGGTS
jgi:hypothetical protein